MVITNICANFYFFIEFNNTQTNNLSDFKFNLKDPS